MKKRKGFTMVELLVTIFLIGLVFSIAGVSVFNLISDSKEKTSTIALENVKKMAGIYVKEMPNEVSWDKVEGETLDQYACISVAMLIEKGYVSSVNKKEIDANSLIKLIKDTDNNIVSEEVIELEDEGIEEIKKACPNVKITVPILTSKDICKNDYSETNIEVGTLFNQDFDDDNDSLRKIYVPDIEDSDGKPGNYEVNLSLRNGADDVNYVWSDGTEEPKKIVCSIDKKKPKVNLEPASTPEGQKGSYEIKVESNVEGKYIIKVSNNDYVSITDLSGGELIKDGNGKITANIKVNPLANRKANTFVTITVVPNDSSYYYSTSVIHTVNMELSSLDLSGIDKKHTITIPNDICRYEDKKKNPLVYNGKDRTLIDSDVYNMCVTTKAAKRKYNCSLIKGKYAGEYEIRLSLNNASGLTYKWNDETISDKVYNCSITEAIVEIPDDICEPKLVNNNKELRLINKSTKTVCVDAKAANRSYNCSTPISATNAGSYDISLKLNNSDGMAYKWSDGTKTDKEYTCNIAKKKITVPKKVCNTKLVNNGKEQQLIVKDVKNICTHKTNTSRYYNCSTPISATNAGSYDVVLSLNSAPGLEYVWDDGTTEDKTYTCNIAKKQITVPTKVCNNNLINNGKEQQLIVKDVKNICTHKTNTNRYYNCSMINAIDAGNYDVVLSLNNAPGLEYVWNDGTTEDKTYTCNIGMKQITVPKTVCKTNLVYNGKDQQLITDTIKNICTNKTTSKKYYNCSIVKAKNAGSYDVVLSLNNASGLEYIWKDGTTENKIYACSIAKRGTSVELKKNSDTVTDLGSVMKSNVAIDYPVTVKSIRGKASEYTSEITGKKTTNVPGVITIEPVVDTDTGLTYIGVKSLDTHDKYNSQTNSYYKATLLGTEIGNKKKFLVKFKPTDTVNFASSSKEHTLTITPSESTLTYDTATNGGNPCPESSKTIYYNASYGELCQPTKDGYVFEGWYTGSADADRVDSKLITADKIYSDKKLKPVKVYAHFRSIDSLTLTFHQYNGTKQESYQLPIFKHNQNEKFSLKMPTPTAYSNSSDCGGSWSARGWSKSTTADASTNYKIGSVEYFTENITLYATYKSEELTLTIDYNGGKAIDSPEFRAYRNAYGTSKNLGPWSYTVSQDAKRSGCTFLGWYEGSSKVISPGDSKTFTICNSDKMISAHWGADCH